MKAEIIDLLNRASFSNDFLFYARHYFPDDYHPKFKQPFNQKSVQNPILKLSPIERVWESIAQLPTLKKFYFEKDIPVDYFYQSIYDLNYRIERFYRKNDQYGLTDNDIKWLSPLYRGEIFDLGSLRFQLSEFSYQEIERQTYQYMPLSDDWKEKFPEGTPIITIHILQDTDFRPQKIDEALTLARDFFARHFPDHDYNFFVCRTWLLYRPTADLLGSDSNIVSFAQRFQIIAQNTNSKQALDRIYGTSDLEAVRQLPKETSLAKKAYKNLDKLGVAAGIIRK